jgi:hypothetical protein
VRSVSLTTQCDQQEGVVNSIDQHEAVVEWTHPSGEHTLERLPSSRIHPIVVGALGHTQAEASITDTKFKRSTKSHTEYVCRINGKRTDKNLATYTTIDANGRIQSTPHDTILTAQRALLYMTFSHASKTSPARSSPGGLGPGPSLYLDGRTALQPLHGGFVAKNPLTPTQEVL